MKTYMEAWVERLQRNQAALIELAKEVHLLDDTIEVYLKNDGGFIWGLIFFKGEEINSIHFHEVPYRWSGCGYGEHDRYHSGGENSSMPFDVQDVLSTFMPITTINQTHNTAFKSKEQYLKWSSWLEQFDFIVWELRHKGELILEGLENQCYMKLQRVQSQSADWAIKYEGYTITPKN